MANLRWNKHYHMVERCSCCDQQTIVYRREITYPMLYCMKVLYVRLDNKPSNYMQIHQSHRVTTDFTKLQYWGLLVNEPKTSLYSLSEFGICFLKNKLTVPQYCWIYNDGVLPSPEGEENPEIYSYEIKPKKLDKESILADSLTLSEYLAKVNDPIPYQRSFL